MLYLKVIACKVLFREISWFAAKSENVIDTTWLKWGAHDGIGMINDLLKAEIAAIDDGSDSHTSFPPYDKPFDAILLGYGLCSNGIVGLSSEKYPLVIPRAHDCISLFLGSKERYQELFNETGGTYWYSPGWVENSPMPGRQRHDNLIEMYTKKYDREKAEHLVELSEEWQKEYSRLALIEWPEFASSTVSQRAKTFAQQSAKEVGWRYQEYLGNSSLVEDFLSGNWDEERFLVVPPGQKVKATYKDDIIGI